ncbi:hypothetical protein ACVIJW_001549 [Bradyrhizobium barranii subsp. barranii]
MVRRRLIYAEWLKFREDIVTAFRVAEASFESSLSSTRPERSPFTSVPVEIVPCPERGGVRESLFRPMAD